MFKTKKFLLGLVAAALISVSAFASNGGGGINPVAPVTNNFLTGVDTSGNYTRAQPSFSNLSGVATPVQLGTGTPTSSNYLRGDGAWATIVGGVSSVFGRTGVVTSQSGDYTVSQVTGAAPLASPTLVTPVIGAATGTSLNLSGVSTASAFTATGTGANVLPVGTTGQEPGSPAVGMLRYNSTLSQFEGYVSSSWQTLRSGPVNLASQVTGTLPVANGGTGQINGSANLLYGAQEGSFPFQNSEGDSITCGVGAAGTTSCSTLGFANILSNYSGAYLTNRGIQGEMACDEDYNEIMANENPSLSTLTYFTNMIGTNDANTKGVGTYENIFKTCHQAGLAWLGVPAEYKVFATTGCTTTGTWSADNSGWVAGLALFSNAAAATISCPITTTGGPIYAWYKIADANTGAGTYSLDGGTPVAFTTATLPTISTLNGGTQGMSLIRLANITAGNHTLLFTVTSGNSGNGISIGGIGTPPALAYGTQPIIYSTGVIKQQNDANSAATLAYDTDAQADNNLLASDGLKIRNINVRNYVNSTTDMYNAEHPNLTGHQHIAQAINAIGQFSYSGPFSVVANNAVYTGGAGGIVQSPVAAANVANYLQTNGGAAISTTGLNPGTLLYHVNGFAYGNDVGYNATTSKFRNRTFAPSNGDIVFATHAASTDPTAQSSFTEQVVISSNGSIKQNPVSAANTFGYFNANGNNTLSTTNLNTGVLLYSANDYFGMDLGYANSRYRTRIFSPAVGFDIAFSTVAANSSPTAQSNFTDNMVIKGDNGFVGIGTSSPTTTLDVNGDITMETGTAGALLCLTSTHAVGHCTAAASCTGTCTCTCAAN
jgi:hypothetical protein